MRFPEQPREGSEAHASALKRLDVARSDQRECSDAADRAAHGTSDERTAANALTEANEQLAAREAWVGWIERGY